MTIRGIRCCLLFAFLAGTLSAFEIAKPGYRYEFPRDHFAHPEFQIEWWYYTGNLKTPEGRRFGFELTFFRSAAERSEPARGPWDIRDLYLAHLTLSDIAGGQFLQQERLNRGGPGLAGADAQRQRIWNGNWQVAWSLPEARQEMHAVTEEFEIRLDLKPAKEPVIHGEDGISRKAAGHGKASHYISFTRLAARGSIRLDGRDFSVEGLVWMDHEFSTDSLGEGQVGWDWMSIQLDDGSDLMLYRMRRADGAADPYSSGTYVSPSGKTLHLRREDFEMTPGERWTSPRTRGRYPVEWRVRVPRLGLALTCTTDLRSQEVVGQKGARTSYWEGAVRYRGLQRGKAIAGRGYLEMTGYDKPLQLAPQ